MQNETLIIEESHARERVDKVIAEMMGKKSFSNTTHAEKR